MNMTVKTRQTVVNDEILRDRDLSWLFLNLLSMADGNGVAVLSVREFAKRMNSTHQKMRTAMRKLADTGLVSVESEGKPPNRQTKVTLQRSARRTAKEPTTPTEVKTDNNNRFVPPTDEEVTEYCNNQGYHFNPETFVPFYASKGWKVGDQLMKDWKAACKTWELSWRNKYGERHYSEVAADERQLSHSRRKVQGAARDDSEGAGRMAAIANAVLRVAADPSGGPGA